MNGVEGLGVELGVAGWSWVVAGFWVWMNGVGSCWVEFGVDGWSLGNGWILGLVKGVGDG